MRIFVTGGTGFIGRPLVRALVKAGHDPVLLVREKGLTTAAPGVETVLGDPLAGGPWQEAVGGCDGAINLAGESIVGRWTSPKKRSIRESRILTTRNLVDAIPPGKPFTLCSSSAVGIYGDAGERELTEEAPLGGDFLASVAREWEAEALAARAGGSRVVLTRFAVVLGPGGGALRELTNLTLHYLDGPVGSGRQWFSWIHRDDAVRVLLHLLEDRGAEGVYNVGAPNPVRQTELARALGGFLHRPAVTRAPGFALRLVLGEAADLLLFSQRMIPARLRKEGFVWLYPHLEHALGNIYNT